MKELFEKTRRFRMDMQAAGSLWLMPTPEQCLVYTNGELSEFMQCIYVAQQNHVRNNPDNKGDSLAMEYGQLLMMWYSYYQAAEAVYHPPSHEHVTWEMGELVEGLGQLMFVNRRWVAPAGDTLRARCNNWIHWLGFENKLNHELCLVMALKKQYDKWYPEPSYSGENGADMNWFHEWRHTVLLEGWHRGEGKL